MQKSKFFRLLFLDTAHCPNLHSFGHAATPSSPPPPSRSARRSLSDIGCRRCSVPSVRTCVSCLVWSALLPVACCCSGRAGVGGGAPEGYTGNAGGGGGSIVSVEKIQKRRFSGFVLPTPTPPLQNETYLIVQVSKNSEKNKKTPYGAIECVILAKERWN